MNGRLNAYWTQGAFSKPENIYEIGSVETSPNELLELAQKNPCNQTKYSAVFQNCQEWVRNFARMIHEDLLRNLENLKSCAEKLVQVAKGAGTVPLHHLSCYNDDGMATI